MNMDMSHTHKLNRLELLMAADDINKSISYAMMSSLWVVGSSNCCSRSNPIIKLLTHLPMPCQSRSSLPQ
jgi:hypothetical protein